MSLSNPGLKIEIESLINPQSAIRNPAPDLCDLSIVSGKMPVATLMIVDRESLPTRDPRSAIRNLKSETPIYDHHRNSLSRNRRLAGHAREVHQRAGWFPIADARRQGFAGGHEQDSAQPDRSADHRQHGHRRNRPRLQTGSGSRRDS